MKVTNENLDNLGWIPVVQNLSALVRLAHGIKEVAKGAFAMIAGNSLKGKPQAKNGLKHMGRALVESIPLVSTIALLIFELNRAHSVSCYACHSELNCTVLAEEKIRRNEVIFGK